MPASRRQRCRQSNVKRKTLIVVVGPHQSDTLVVWRLDRLGRSLEFVVGSSATQVLVDESPIVMWDFRNGNTAEWKERSHSKTSNQ